MKIPPNFRNIPGQGTWVDDVRGVCVSINEDTCLTYCAFRSPRPVGSWYSDAIVRNAAGNPVRFRSVEAAIKALD
jgi:hypothetical protein